MLELLRTYFHETWTHFDDFGDDFLHRNLSINLRLDTHRNAHTHDEQKPREHKISKVKAIPRSMINPPVAAATRVHEDHENDGYSSKNVETL